MRDDIFWAPPGIHNYQESATPEARAAQHQAELEQLSRYRSRKINYYKRWADPTKREELNKELLAENEAARQIFLRAGHLNPSLLAPKPFTGLEITPIVKFLPLKYLSQSRWQRFKAWISAIFSRT